MQAGSLNKDGSVILGKKEKVGGTKAFCQEFGLHIVDFLRKGYNVTKGNKALP